ncbi:hypothetical protein [Corynebacterium bovis]|uniref:hypothetical protein n=1 Tax=Corynebacterium bovis TaxID=36808 RepID=UPI00313947AB
MADRHCDTQPITHQRQTITPRLSFARRCANLGRFRLIPSFAHAITGLFTTTPNPHHDRDQNQGTTTDNDGDVHGPDLPPDHTRALAAGINLLINTATRAQSAWSIRGELAAWRHAMPDLPDSFDDAVDTLTVYEDHFINQLHHDWTQLTPTITNLNRTQPSPTCWARPADTTHQKCTWTGRDQWITHACTYLDHTMRGPGMACSPANRHALVTALAHSAQPDGHNLTAAHRTIADRAITDHGCTLSLSTATHRLRVIRYLLENAGFHHTDAHGGHMDARERLAAYVHHGGRQTQCANTAHLTLPAHLRPTPPASPHPAYATDLAERLAARDAAEVRKYTYSYTHRPLPLTDSHRVAHKRAHAREHPEIQLSEALQGPSGHPAAASHSTNTAHTTAPTGHTAAYACPDTPAHSRKAPSLRAWRIADDLTRTVNGCTAANGPYAALVGPGTTQCRLTTLARLIDTHTPDWATTRDVMRAIAHHATSPTTGHIALGLPRHRNHLPHNPTGWMTTLITRLTWNDTDHHPTWHTTATAFGTTWNGTRHRWTPIG